MKVILIKDVDNLGGAHEIVEVRPGYARNFLIPQKHAIEASASNVKIQEERQKQIAKKEEKLLANIASVKAALETGAVKLTAKIGENGKIFGSVTSIQLARAIREQKQYEIDRRRISILDEIKEAGSYKAQIDFGKDHVLELTFDVVGE
ncbi:50S ribosomal protein L9 [Taibaiella sp. KBW10]|uniref:50S ribosomal protein L9 n=1 Tax=Taibaiella sp. KBW10 TaxID=2153357 RepID=UPI000F5B0B5C|nr:50S ribosomal protein L9 [Taibaiella sp. KBW10]RQO31388.1 50S ribosomal protein L9 [Taibaiella sp. KBW10]